jgi:pimeloyl-ACP methyl ester carboxylesterase
VTASFTQRTLDVNGVETVVLEAGGGEPLVFLHGAGTITGFDSLLPLAERFRLIVPHHPGFGLSADDPTVGRIEDYARHYLDVFDLMGIREISLVGHSMGGYLAATLAIDGSERVRRLVLAAPLGLRVPEHPTADIFTIPGDQFLEHLAADLSIFEGKVPDPPTPEFLAHTFRETTSAARILWERPYDPRLPRWLHRLTMPTLLLWGDADRIIPVEQIDVWADHVRGAERRILPGVGHLLFDESADAVTAVADFVGEELTV